MARSGKPRHLSVLELLRLEAQYEQEGGIIRPVRKPEPNTRAISRKEGPSPMKGGESLIERLPANKPSTPMIRSGFGRRFDLAVPDEKLGWSAEDADKYFVPGPTVEFGCWTAPEHAPVSGEVQARADATTETSHPEGWGMGPQYRDAYGRFRPEPNVRPGLRTQVREVKRTEKGVVRMRQCCASTSEDHRSDCKGTRAAEGTSTPRRFDSTSRTRITRDAAVEMVGEDRVVREETLREGKEGRFPLTRTDESTLVLVQTTTKTGRTRCDYFIWE